VTDLSFGLDNIHEVRVRHVASAPGSVNPADSESLAAMVKLSPEQEEAAEKAVQVIQDPALRVSFLHAYEAWLRWNIWHSQEQQKRRTKRTLSHKY